MRQPQSRSQGFTLVVVMLLTLVAIATTASVSTLASRTALASSRAELQASQALFAAESGLASVLARSRANGFVDAPGLDARSIINAWLVEQGLDDYALPDGSRVQLLVVGDNPSVGTVTLRSVGRAAGNSAQRVILQDFEVRFGSTQPRTTALASLVTKTAIRSNAARARLLGLDATESAWRFPSTLARSQVGDVVYGNLFGTVEPERYRVISSTTTTRTLRAVSDGETRVLTNLAMAAQIIPYNIGLPVSVPWGASPPPYAANPPPSHIAVTNGAVFQPGQEIRVCGRGTTCSDPSHDNVAVVLADGWDPDTQLLAVHWTRYTYAMDDAATVRATVASAVAEGGCPSTDQQQFPQGCIDGSSGGQLGDLWATTFGGTSKTELRDIAMRLQRGESVPGWEGRSGSYYGPRTWPSSVSGLTWIDGAQTAGRQNALCGSGIVVLNTGASLDDAGDSTINLTTAGCTFRGILYVIGQLKMVGNLSGLSGAVYIEGPGGVTEIQGTGDKALFDPIAVRDALNALPGERIFQGLYAAVDRSWRIGRAP